MKKDHGIVYPEIENNFDFGMSFKVDVEENKLQSTEPKKIEIR